MQEEVIDLTGDDEQQQPEMARQVPVLLRPPTSPLQRMKQVFSNGRLVFELVVPGNPRALPRMRRFRGGFWNPAKARMNEFKLLARNALQQQQRAMLFPKGTTLSMAITFYMRRPKSHFKKGLLTPNARVNSSPPLIPDVDNLTKFVLDVLTGVVYHDDGQVTTLLTTKIRDNEGQCEGRTHVMIFNNN